MIKVFVILSMMLVDLDPINQISKVIVGPDFMAFKNMEKDDVWTIQTLARNFDVYKLTISGTADSIVNREGAEISYYSRPDAVLYFSEWRSGIDPKQMPISDLRTFNSDNEVWTKENVSMIAFLNRKKFWFIPDFFNKTISIGSKSVTNSLENPIRIIDYEAGKRLIYHDNDKIHAVYPQRQMSLDKINFNWEFTGDGLIVYPKLNYIKTKPITAITDKRTWYNKQWEAMYNKRILYATIKEGVFKWNTDGLNETEIDLINWFKKN